MDERFASHLDGQEATVQERVSGPHLVLIWRVDIRQPAEGFARCFRVLGLTSPAVLIDAIAGGVSLCR